MPRHLISTPLGVGPYFPYWPRKSFLNTSRYAGAMEHRIWIAALTLLFTAAPALGEEALVISPADCARLVEHVASADVAYQPGVDVNGNSVASADLNGDTRLDLNGEDIAIDIALPLRATEGTVDDVAAFEAAGGKIDNFDATGNVGVVTIRDGIVYFNDKAISSRENELLAAACREG